MMTPIQFANYKRVLKALEKMGEKILRISVCPDSSIEISCGDRVGRRQIRRSRAAAEFAGDL